MFSYAGKTCFYQPTLMPGLLRSQSDSFRLEADQRLMVGDFVVAAASMCAVPTKAPNEGSSVAALSLLGTPIKKIYTVKVVAAPRLDTAAIYKRPLPASRALTLPMSEADTVFSYKIAASSKTAPCISKGRELACDIPQLGLAQGTEYSLRIERYFNDKKISTVSTNKVTTLTATSVKSASVKENEVVFAKPTSIELTTDKDITSASVRLYKVEGDKRTEVRVTEAHAHNKLTASWGEDLPRQTSYELVADSIVGADGSGLDGSYRLRFSTSGGPKVQSISVGSYKVAPGSTAIITFDQPLSDGQPLAEAITVSGGATISGKNGNRVMINFAGVPKCGDVRISVNDKLKSSHDITGGSAWSYDTRTLCQSVGSIGTSVKGRSIPVYSFGNGSGVVLYTGAIHGNETSTRSLMLRWIDELEAKPRSIPADKTVVVIPSINPDGVAAGSRTNSRNVDLNRNFATSDWKSDITTVTNAPFPGGGGASALSEPESKALAGYVARVKPRLVLSYHSIGGLVAANQAGDSAARTSTYARLSGYANTTGSSDTFEYGISGTADDYYGQVLGVPSMLIELGSHTYHQFERNRDAMWAMLK